MGIKHIVEIFIREKDIKRPHSLSKEDRMQSMFNIISDNIYGQKFTIDEKLFAVELLKKILKE